MASLIFLSKEISKLKNKSEITKGELLRLFELVTYLTINKEITLTDAEHYTTILFKLLEELKP